MKSTQSDQGLYFDGAADNGVSKSSTRFAHNQHTGHSNDGRLVNYGTQHKVGNQGTKKAPATDAVKGKFGNPDSINVGNGPRTPGGTRQAKCPSNYDRQNVGRGPTKGNE